LKQLVAYSVLHHKIPKTLQEAIHGVVTVPRLLDGFIS